MVSMVSVMGVITEHAVSSCGLAVLLNCRRSRRRDLVRCQ